MTEEWSHLITANLVEGQDWEFSGLTTALEFRIEQTNFPKLGQFSIAQVLPGTPLNFFSIQNIPARAEAVQITLNPGPDPLRILAIRYRYAEWENGFLPWQVKIFQRAKSEQEKVATILVDIAPRLIGAEPLGAEERAKSYCDARLSEAVFQSVTLESLQGEPIGAEARAIESMTASLQSQEQSLISRIEAEGSQSRQFATQYCDSSIAKIDPISIENRAKAYTDEQLQLISAKIHPISDFIYGGSLIANPSATLININGGYISQMWHHPTTTVAGAALDFGANLAKGRYHFRVFTQRSSNRGIFQVFLNSEVASSPFDLYTSTAQNFVAYVAIEIPKDGIQIFSLRVIGKNESSTAFLFAVSGVGIQKI